MSGISLVSVYATLMLAAFILIGAEVYVPGGVLGAFGAACLVAAVVVGFRMGPIAGWAGLGVVLALSAVGVYFWMTLFPRTAAGRRLSLGREGTGTRASDPAAERLAGQAGVALSPLRPAGVARIGGHRVDVLSENGVWIEAGSVVRVSRVTGGRLYVETVSGPAKDSPS
jgi:membrane-bound serine protease (ClpP class)